VTPSSVPEVRKHGECLWTPGHIRRSAKIGGFVARKKKGGLT
jgi:hypothetical protein